MIKLVVNLTLMLALFSAANGQIFLRGPCPNTTFQENFDIEKYAGTWYEVERSFALFQLGLKCVTAEYRVEQADSISIVNKGVELGGIQRSVKGEGIVKDASQPANISVKLEGGLPFAVPYFILATDYDNYALVFSCLKVGIVHSENMWILGRKPTLGEDKLVDLKELFKKNGINPKALQPTAQDCSE